MPENFRHFHDFPVDGDMVPTEGSLKCRKFSGTFRHFQWTVTCMVQTGGSLIFRHFHDFPVDGDMVPTRGSLKCRKISGTFMTFQWTVTWFQLKGH